MGNNFFARLEALRELTKLSPAEYVKIFDERKKREQFDCSEAYELEYNMRLEKFAKIVEITWKKYIQPEDDSISLKQFAENILDDYVEEKREVRIRRK